MYQFIIIFCTDKNLFNRAEFLHTNNVYNDSWMFAFKKNKTFIHMQCLFVYLCIYCLPAQHADGTTVLPWCCFQENLPQARHRSSSFLFFCVFLKYVVKENATFNFTAVLSYGRSGCQHRKVISSKTWSILLKLMTSPSAMEHIPHSVKRLWLSANYIWALIICTTAKYSNGQNISWLNQDVCDSLWVTHQR